MLPQLVGMSCAICAERIAAEIDGRSCEVWGMTVVWSGQWVAGGRSRV
jgi:hypothetical protein